MPTRSMKQDDPLEDFTRRDVTFDGIGKAVYVAGVGPAVIVMRDARHQPTCRTICSLGA
jgi:hypothetical protein